MTENGITSKTKAVDMALREMDRRATLIRLCSEGTGLGASELKEAFDPNYNLEATREMEMPVSYGRKPRTR